MTGLEKVYLGFAVFGGALFLGRLVLFFVGLSDFGGDIDVDADVDVDVDVDIDVDADVDADVEGADQSFAAFRLLSFQGLTAFFTIFGLMGLTLLKEAGVSAAASIIGAFLAGSIAFGLMLKVMSLMQGLQSSGTLRMANAIGQEGSVYLTIHPGGVGKVQVIVQDRLMHLNAVAEGEGELKTGDRVVVVGLTGDNTLVVKELGPEGQG